MSTPVARTLREAYLYLEATLPGQEIIDFDRSTRLEAVGRGGHILHFDGTLAGRRVSSQIEIRRTRSRRTSSGSVRTGRVVRLCWTPGSGRWSS